MRFAAGDTPWPAVRRTGVARFPKAAGPDAGSAAIVGTLRGSIVIHCDNQMNEWDNDFGRSLSLSLRLKIE